MQPEVSELIKEDDLNSGPDAGTSRIYMYLPRRSISKQIVGHGKPRIFRQA